MYVCMYVGMKVDRYVGRYVGTAKQICPKLTTSPITIVVRFKCVQGDGR